MNNIFFSVTAETKRFFFGVWLSLEYGGINRTKTDKKSEDDERESRNAWFFSHEPKTHR